MALIKLIKKNFFAFKILYQAAAHWRVRKNIYCADTHCSNLHNLIVLMLAEIQKVPTKKKNMSVWILGGDFKKWSTIHEEYFHLMMKKGAAKTVGSWVLIFHQVMTSWSTTEGLKQAAIVYVDMRYCGTVWNKMFWSYWKDQREKLSQQCQWGWQLHVLYFFVLKGMYIN